MRAHRIELILDIPPQAHAIKRDGPVLGAQRGSEQRDKSYGVEAGRVSYIACFIWDQQHPQSLLDYILSLRAVVWECNPVTRRHD